MSSVVLAACPTCNTSLPGGTLAGICPVCAWTGLEATFDVDAVPTAEGTLFAVEGHDVLAEIARGGGGIVYRARQHQPRRDVALKMLPPALLASRELQARFRLEAETVAALHHPAILPVYTVGERDGLPYFTMKLAERGSLATRRAAYRGRWRDIATLLVTLAEAVQHAHSRGVVHRDLKPGNVLFDETERAYVSDFGLAKFVTADTSVTRASVVMGTPAYLAPEVVAGGAGAATTSSDVYGLGGVLYELLTGRPPFAAESVPELLRRIAVDQPTPPARVCPGVPRDLEVICLACLEKEPARRLPSAAALAEDLARWLQHRPIVSRPVPRARRVVQWARREPALAVLSAVLVLAVLTGGGAILRRNRELEQALARAAVAEAAAQERLHRSLLDQARAMRASGQQGQRIDALAVLEQAAAIRRTDELRSETAAALALPDLRLERTLEGRLLDEASNVGFAPDFKSYLTYSGHNALELRDAAEGRVLRRFEPTAPGATSHFFWGGAGRWFLARYADRRTEAWCVDENKPGWVFPRRPAPHGALACALHPHEALCAWPEESGEIRIRHLVTGETQTLTGPGRGVDGLAYSPDGARLAVGRTDRIGVVDAVSGREAWTRAGRIWDLVWSGDGRWLAGMAALSGEVQIFDGQTGRPVRTLPPEANSPEALCFRPGKPYLAVLSRIGTLTVWNVLTGQPVLRASMGSRLLAFSPDGSLLAASPRQFDVAVYAWLDSAVFREFGNDKSLRLRGAAVAVSPDAKFVASASTSQARVWEIGSGEECAAFDFAPVRDVTSMHFTAEGAALLTSGSSSGIVRRRVGWDERGTASRPTLGEPEPVASDRPGRLIGWGTGGRDWFVERAQQVVVWSDGDPQRERVLTSAARGGRPAVSRDGNWVITMGSPLPDARVTEVVSGRVTRLPLGPHHASAAFSPDSRWLVTGADAEYHLWSLPALEQKARWTTQVNGGAGVIAFSPDGRWLALEDQRGEIVVREARTFTVVTKLIPPVRMAPDAMAWSPDGTRLYLLAVGLRLYEWNLAALQRELHVRGVGW